MALVTKNGQSAGIVLNENNQTISYLNQNKKCTYSVFIGKQNAPGITYGTDDKNNIIIKHIPKWYKININDRVITSGMDSIFPNGIKVGKIIELKDDLNTKIAIVKPNENSLGLKYFYIIKK